MHKDRICLEWKAPFATERRIEIRRREKTAVEKEYKKEKFTKNFNLKKYDKNKRALLT